MEKIISATEAVRNFSEIINSIRFTGSRYIVQRNGKPVVHMGPVAQANRSRTLKELKSIFRDLPKLAEESEAFSADLVNVTDTQPSLPEAGPWE